MEFRMVGAITTAMAKRGTTGDKDRRALLAFMDARGLNPADWSRKAGVSSSSIYNFIHGRSESLHSTTMRRLANAANVPVSAITGELATSPTLSFPAIEVRGSVNAGTWREAAEWPRDDWETMYVPVAKPYKDSVFGLKVEGPSMNQVYPEGTILVCVSLYDYGAELASLDRVIVHRSAPDGSVEATVKEMKVDANGRVWLWPRSDHPAHQQPIPLPKNPSDGLEILEADGTIVQVVAIVIGSYRPEKAL